MKALTFARCGGAEVLEYADIPQPTVQKNEVLIATKAMGVNLVDICHRKSDYLLKRKPPYVAGYEGAGEVIASNSTKFKIGDKVAFVDVSSSHAEMVVAHEDKLISLPDDISFETAAAVLFQGLSAYYLTNDCHTIKKGELLLIHEAACGLGLLLVQFGKLLGAKVIGITHTLSQKQVITSLGADEVFIYQENWKNKVMAFAHYKGVDVVYDSVGQTLGESLEVVKIGGKVVFFGMSGGEPALVNPRTLLEQSKSLVGADVWSVLISSEERNRRANIIFDMLRNKKIKIHPPV
ncbi:MAG: zinc-binding dehydrogenase, partial [Flammeovirgaceae bacterium]|nr:zinc-binding dehydrogenase [Flammeovirgaceae bacterium]MDW8287711.1 zinc-binding dehydrogenase [Flammeovirgaceae bacterium]